MRYRAWKLFLCMTIVFAGIMIYKAPAAKAANKQYFNQVTLPGSPEETAGMYDWTAISDTVIKGISFDPATRLFGFTTNEVSLAATLGSNANTSYYLYVCNSANVCETIYFTLYVAVDSWGASQTAKFSGYTRLNTISDVAKIRLNASVTNQNRTRYANGEVPLVPSGGPVGPDPDGNGTIIATNEVINSSRVSYNSNYIDPSAVEFIKWDTSSNSLAIKVNAAMYGYPSTQVRMVVTDTNTKTYIMEPHRYTGKNKYNWIPSGNPSSLSSGNEGTIYWSQQIDSGADFLKILVTLVVPNNANGLEKTIEIYNPKYEVKKFKMNFMDNYPPYYWTSLESVAFGNNVWVVVGQGYNGLRSTDGLNWSLIQPSGDIYRYNKVKFINGYFYAIGTGGIARSTDGLNWQKTGAPNSNWTDMVYANGKYLILSHYVDPDNSNNQSSAVYSSTDGYNFSYGVGFNMHNMVASSIIWDGSRFIAFAGYTNTALTYQGTGVIYSYDGVNWTKDPVDSTSGRILNLIHYNGQYLATVIYGYNYGSQVTKRASTLAEIVKDGQGVSSVDGSVSYLDLGNGRYIGIGSALRFTPDVGASWKYIRVPKKEINYGFKSGAFGNGRLVAVGGQNNMIVSDIVSPPNGGNISTNPGYVTELTSFGATINWDTQDSFGGQLSNKIFVNNQYVTTVQDNRTDTSWRANSFTVNARDYGVASTGNIPVRIEVDDGFNVAYLNGTMATNFNVPFTAIRQKVWESYTINTAVVVDNTVLANVPGLHSTLTSMKGFLDANNIILNYITVHANKTLLETYLGNRVRVIVQ